MDIRKILSINLLFIFVVILLTLIGTAALYSAAKGNFEPWAIRHIFRFGICLIMIMIIVSIDIRIIYKFSYHIFIICLLLLISVEIVGTFGKGAERWIKIFGVTFQPSEIIKVSIILALAKFYHDIRFDKIGKIYNLIFPLLVILIPSIFIIFQPDLGTAITVLLLGSILMFLAGVKLWKFFLGFLIVFFSTPFLWSYIKPYQKKRILSFLNPESDPLGQGYQLTQSKIALGSGSIAGKGFLEGTQSYLEFLPEKQTDFIFTLIGEEFGFIGIIFVMFLFLILIMIGFYISIKSYHVFGRLLSLGVATNIFIYVFFNMAMVIGLMPVVGIPLPLISYGGTAMLSVMISFGLLLNTEIHYNYKKLN